MKHRPILSKTELGSDSRIADLKKKNPIYRQRSLRQLNENDRKFEPINVPSFCGVFLPTIWSPRGNVLPITTPNEKKITWLVSVCRESNHLASKFRKSFEIQNKAANCDAIDNQIYPLIHHRTYLSQASVVEFLLALPVGKKTISYQPKVFLHSPSIFTVRQCISRTVMTGRH